MVFTTPWLTASSTAEGLARRAWLRSPTALWAKGRGGQEGREARVASLVRASHPTGSPPARLLGGGCCCHRLLVTAGKGGGVAEQAHRLSDPELQRLAAHGLFVCVAFPQGGTPRGWSQ